MTMALRDRKRLTMLRVPRQDEMRVFKIQSKTTTWIVKQSAPFTTQHARLGGVTK